MFSNVGFIKLLYNLNISISNLMVRCRHADLEVHVDGSLLEFMWGSSHSLFACNQYPAPSIAAS